MTINAPARRRTRKAAPARAKRRESEEQLVPPGFYSPTTEQLERWAMLAQDRIRAGYAVEVARCVLVLIAEVERLRLGRPWVDSA